MRCKDLVISIILVVALMAIATLMQLLVGNVPVEIFRFPLNLIIAAVWLYIIVELYRSRQRSAVAQYLLSPMATWL